MKERKIVHIINGSHLDGSNIMNVHDAVFIEEFIQSFLLFNKAFDKVQQKC